jgi:hypothetical protein
MIVALITIEVLGHSWFAQHIDGPLLTKHVEWLAKTRVHKSIPVRDYLHNFSVLSKPHVTILFC